MWSDWKSFEIAAPHAPLVPGVYQMRKRDGLIVYVGMAGERRGQGIRGRLSIYRRGKGAVSGFGEAALDRALADAAFVEKHLEDVRAGNPVRASIWAQDAIRWLDVEVRWAECETGPMPSRSRARQWKCSGRTRSGTGLPPDRRELLRVSPHCLNRSRTSVGSTQ